MGEESDSSPVGHRFSNELAAIAKLKCFDYRDSFAKYVEYMSAILQKKRVGNEYTFRSTNKSRDKNAECIWNDIKKLEELRKHLIESFDYYNFCSKCIGSDDDLLAVT